MSDDTPDPDDLSIPSSVDDGGSVPIEELEALVSKLRREVDWGCNDPIVNKVTERHADELQELIDSYE